MKKSTQLKFKLLLNGSCFKFKVEYLIFLAAVFFQQDFQLLQVKLVLSKQTWNKI